jgi:outer membrane receptor protein involved in Fe transport
VETLSVPLAARYFDPSGFFAGVGVTFVDQQVVRSDDAKFFLGLSDGGDEFSVVDLAIGWRFPERIGIASLTVNNLFDETFSYQDDSFREFREEPTTGPYTPGVKVVGRVTLDLSALFH